MNILSSNRKYELPQIAKKVYERKKSVMPPWRRSGVRRPNTELILQHFVFRPRQPHLTELHCQNLVLISVTDCGCKDRSTACCNASNKTAAGPAGAEPLYPRSMKLFAK